MNVQWTHTALEQLSGLHACVAQTSPDYARRIVDRLTKLSQGLSDAPMAGEVVPQMGQDHIREVVDGPFQLIYSTDFDRIDVLAVVLGGGDLPWYGGE